TVKHPSTVTGEKVMGRNENLESFLFRGLEDPLHVLDGIVLPDTVATQCPRKAFVTQHVILWVDEHDRSIGLTHVHCCSPYVWFYLTRMNPFCPHTHSLDSNGS